MMTGRAVNSVAPSNAKDYIKKIECFCFAEGIELMPGEEILLPIKMVVDNELPDDIKNIVLSYVLIHSFVLVLIVMLVRGRSRFVILVTLYIRRFFGPSH